MSCAQTKNSIKMGMGASYCRGVPRLRHGSGGSGCFTCIPCSADPPRPLEPPATLPSSPWGAPRQFLHPSVQFALSSSTVMGSPSTQDAEGLGFAYVTL